ncbi:MAG: DUF202 domain-containing protein [Alicyclobacillus herbarius]|uniref:YidH family protein n=1 Tax=Alicyclobacillus herbarius TaxID=122960 RepID=UPI00235554DF|nr:DUF202 domain-containing protein [Alicyclobacillus herbarius]MCL6634136.1 DUF202 domain-containing protein [Alicyclobacillus herbarius]
MQHLANERTVLAWLRFIISISGVGFALISLSIDTHNSGGYAIRVVAEGLTLFGALASILATIQYFKKRAEINLDDQRSRVHSFVWLYGLLGVVLVLTAGIVIMQFSRRV